ncbi:MAG: OmpA family protein [Bacteroidales bacterium]|nr:OmpA family protein [Bacteroidales bacterium]
MISKKTYSLIITFLLLLNFNLGLFAGNDLSDRAKYKQAEKHLVFDEFDKALELYLSLYEDNEQNFNYVYKIGYCYLVSEKQQNIVTAIEYLLLASDNVDKKYKNKYKEDKAPIVSHYYLGIAYRLNEDFEKAIDAFNVYKQKMSRKDSKTVPGMFVDREIQSCSDAMEEIDVKRMNIEKIFVEGLQDPNVRCPILCWDANRLIFTNGKYNVFPPDINYNTEYSEGPFDGVYMAERGEDGTFFNPQNITADLQISDPFIPVTATSDGSELYLVVDHYDKGDIYVSKFKDGKYQLAKKVNSLSSRKWESHATITADGKRIYFTSLRKGGEGGLDIWYSDRGQDGKWQKPINAGPEINTPFHEEMPYVTRNGNALYFSSEAHDNIGGFDVFYSSKDEENQKWRTPVNLGYPFSTAGNDMGYVIENTPVFAFCPVNDNKRRRGVGDCDCISLIDELAPQIASITGLISLDPENPEKLMQVRVKLVDENTGEEIANVKVDENGMYVVDSINAGSYEISAYDNDSNLISESMQVPSNDGKWDITEVNLTIDYPDLVYADAETDISEQSELVTDKDLLVSDHQTILEEKVIVENVLFDFDRYNIKSEYINNLNKLADYMNNNPNAEIEIAGHTDWIGTNEYNYLLSSRRSKSVKDYLVRQGNNPDNIVTTKHGEDNPIASNANPDGTDNPVGRKYNRRAVFIVHKQGDVSMLEVRPFKLDLMTQNNTNGFNSKGENLNINSFIKTEGEKYTMQIFALKNERPVSYFPEINDVKKHVSDEWYRYYVGEFETYEDAQVAVDNLKAKGYNPFIREISFFEK